jgi:hypothetical protein
MPSTATSRRSSGRPRCSPNRPPRRPTGAELLLVNGRVELVGRSDDVRNRLTAAGTTVVYDTCDAHTAVERMLAASE